MTASKFQPDTFPKTVAEVTQPTSGAIMHKEYVKTIGKMAQVWGWPLVNSHNRRAGITQAPAPGRLGGVVPVAPRGRLCMLNGYDNWSMSYPLMTDFYLELRFITGPECESKDRYGILFRAPDSTQGYLYNVSCDGYFQVHRWDGEEFTELLKWTLNDHIITGPEIEHRLGVWAEGDQYKLYVNGFQIGEFTDGTYVGEGTFGAAHGATDTVGFTVDVTEAKVWELPK